MRKLVIALALLCLATAPAFASKRAERGATFGMDGHVNGTMSTGPDTERDPGASIPSGGPAVHDDLRR
jgi:hypothetical protein